MREWLVFRRSEARIVVVVVMAKTTRGISLKHTEAESLSRPFTFVDSFVFFLPLAPAVAMTPS